MCVKGRIKSSSKIVCAGKRMGDFAAPAAAANGSSICINNNLNSSLSGAGGAGIGVNSTPHGPPAAAAGNNNANSGGIPKHSTVVERLRQRIEGCRRHHVNCESRYQQAQAEQLELERRDTVSLYQRTLEQRAKKTGTGGGSKQQQQQSKQQQDAEPATAEQRNHTLIMVNVLIVASIISCVAILIVVVYSAFTLNYGEEEELSSAPVHVIHTKFVLNKVVKGANVAMLAASICSAFVVLVMAYLGCRSLPRCSCYDSVTGMEWLQPSEDQDQAVEMVCAVQSRGGRIFNSPDRFPAQDLDAEEDASKPPPYIRMA